MQPNQVLYGENIQLSGNGAGTLSATGNITGGNIITGSGNASLIYSTGNIQAVNNVQANTVTTTAFVSTPSLFTSDLTPPGGGPLLTTTSLSTINGNLSVTGTITGAGNITGGNVITGGLISATGNVNGGNLRTTGVVTATGNVIAAGIYTGGDVSAAGNIIGVSLVGSVVSVSGNIIGGAITGTSLSASGNISTGSFFKAQSYTAAALTAITGSIGQMAAVSNSAGGGNPNGMIAFWDTTHARWSYIHDNTAV